MAFSTGCGFLPARSPRRATWASQLCRKSRLSTATATWFIPQSQWCWAWTCSKNGSSRKTKGDFTELAVFPWIMGYQPLQPTSSTAHGWLFFGCITQRRGGPIWRHLGERISAVAAFSRTGEKWRSKCSIPDAPCMAYLPTFGWFLG